MVYILHVWFFSPYFWVSSLFPVQFGLVNSTLPLTTPINNMWKYMGPETVLTSEYNVHLNIEWKSMFRALVSATETSACHDEKKGMLTAVFVSDRHVSLHLPHLSINSMNDLPRRLANCSYPEPLVLWHTVGDDTVDIIRKQGTWCFIIFSF